MIKKNKKEEFPLKHTNIATFTAFVVGKSPNSVRRIVNGNRNNADVLNAYFSMQSKILNAIQEVKTNYELQNDTNKLTK